MQTGVCVAARFARRLWTEPTKRSSACRSGPSRLLWRIAESQSGGRSFQHQPLARLRDSAVTTLEDRCHSQFDPVSRPRTRAGDRIFGPLLLAFLIEVREHPPDVQEKETSTSIVCQAGASGPRAAAQSSGSAGQLQNTLFLREAHAILEIHCPRTKE